MNHSCPLSRVVLLLIGLPACSASSTNRTAGVTPTEACHTKGALTVHLATSAPSDRCIARGAVESEATSTEDAYDLLQEHAAEHGANYVQVSSSSRRGDAGAVTLHGTAFRCPHDALERKPQVAGR